MEEFPWTNKSGAEFEQKANQAIERMAKRSIRRIGCLVLLVAVGIGGVVLLQ